MNLRSMIATFFKTEVKPPAGEDATASGKQHRFSIYGEKNPDDLVRRKGMPYFQNISRKNGYTYGLEQQRKKLNIGRGWEIQPHDPEDANSIMQAEFVTDAFKRVHGRFDDVLNDILDGIFLGYSITEIVWDEWQSREYGYRVGISALKSKNPAEFDFKTDKFGNIQALLQDQGSKSKVELDPSKFVIGTYDGKGGNPYGIGIYMRIYWSDWFITEGWKIWASACERYGQPIVLVKPNGSDPTDVETIIENLQRRTGLTIPDAMDISYLEMTQSDPATYERMIGEHKRNIQIAMLGQSLTSEQGEIGSQALGKVHMNVLDAIIDDDTRWMHDIINDQVIRPLIDMNFADVAGYPTMTTPVDDDLSITERTDVIVKLLGAGYPASLEYIKDVTGVEMAIDDADTLKAPPVVDVVPSDTEDNPDEFSVVSSTQTKKVGRDVDSIELSGIDEYRDLWKSNVDDLIKQATPSLESGIVAIEPTIKRKPLTNVLQRTYLLSYLTGRVSAIDELDKVQKFATDTRPPVDPIPPPQEALDWYNSIRDPLSAKDMQAARSTALDRATALAMDDVDYATKIVRNALRESISSGWGVDQFKAAVNQAFGEYTSSIPTRLDLIFRNVTMSALNSGRMEIFKQAENQTDPDPVVAYRYDAILDERTSAFCEAMAGRVMQVGDPMIQRVTPPNHHRCRSMLTPIVRSEHDKSNPKITKGFPTVSGEIVTPQKGFGG